MSELYEEFQEFRKILCVCPCCGNIVRVSDLKLKVKGKKINTWLDEHKKKQELLEKEELKFDEKKKQLREKYQDKGRKEAEAIFKKAMPSFNALKIDPSDLKPILNPVDFIVFDGMNKQDTINDIILLSKQNNEPKLNLARKQIEKAIIQKKYEWQVARIDEEGKIIFE